LPRDVDVVDSSAGTILRLGRLYVASPVKDRSESEGTMNAAVFYATRQGQARRVAERVAADLRARQTGVDVFDVRTLPPRIDWTPYDFACVVASVHAGRHDREMVDFVTRYRNELQRVGAVFLSLTLSEAGAEVRPGRGNCASRAAPTFSG
jgi:hypothetical protein